ncbi:MAG TPA: beta-ribofuranosylaminobenzene 5'-phosphate synthase family protein [Methylibium sp.]|nr:beta-ribofuranosylaminobenzene 5'-phosphate synthase family protein [Methylibium sp.]
MPLSHASATTDATVGVGVAAPGRLHLGFLDPSATLGRRFGSLGLVVGGLQTRLTLERAVAPRLSNAAPKGETELQRAAEHLAMLQRHTGRSEPLHLHLAEALPAHAGFGSGTQLALAVGRAFAALHGLNLATAEIARLLGRGLRSGIGIAAFDQGGLLLDGGPGADGTPAPLLARVTLPAAWRVLLVLDPARDGLSGAPEKEAIEALPRFPQEAAAAVCHEVLMRVLAGAAGHDFAAFAAGVSRVQQLVGGHFAPAQGGSVYASAAVARVCEWIARHETAGVGQSSWGPTGFAILPSAAAAERVQEAVRNAGVVDPGLRLRIVAPRAGGAAVEPCGA